MNRLRNVCSFWLILLALASGASVAALKTKPAPQFPDGGVTLDVSDWAFRKSVVVSNSGPQQLELDLDVLSNAQREGADLRLMRQGEQIPYVIEPATVRGFITPAVTVTNDPQNPTLSRWLIHLPRAHLPVTELRCETTTSVFERAMTLSETLREADRGEVYERMLARGTWTKTPASSKDFNFTLNPAPLTDTLILEAQNGDNPPIQLAHFQLVYTTVRILFEAKPSEELFLYYGNTSAAAPRYDLNLVSTQLRSVNKSIAALGPEETLKISAQTSGASEKVKGQIFWVVLALVVVVLLVVIARLLPKPHDQPPR